MHRHAAGTLLILILAATAAACDPTDPGPGIEPDSSFATSCAEEGPSHSGAVNGYWGAHDGPHHLTSSVTVSGTLTIEAGALICAAESAAIGLEDGGLVQGEGSAEAPIVFTAEDSLRPWGGFRGGYPLVEGSVELEHARVEHAERGVVAEHVELSDVVIRRVQGEAVYVSSSFGGRGNALRRVLIDRACLSEGSAAVYQESRSDLALEDVVIRDAGCRGIFAQEFALRLRNVRIEGSAGIGFEQYWSGRAGGPDLVSVEGLRITGGADLPLSVNGEAARKILSTIPVDSLTGNAVDRIRIFHWIPAGIAPTPELGWELGRSPNVDAMLNEELVLEPGSHLRVNEVHAYEGFRLLAEGTAQAPVRIDAAPGESRGLQLPGEAGDASRLAHVRLDGIALRSKDGHTLIASDVSATRGFIWLDSPGSVLQNVTLQDAHARGLGPPLPALFVSAPEVALENITIRGSAGTGLLITAADVTVEECEITGSAGDAVWVANEATGVSVHECNLTDNEGLGLRNTAPDPVDARFNWWGDPVGPTGPDGAGVSGSVDVDPWLTAPAGDSALAISCDQAGPTHSGAVTGRWGAYGGPHHVSGVTVEDSLVIETGARVCMTEGATIQVYSGARLTARGTEDGPIVFTAQDSTRPWGGFSHTNAGYDEVVLSIGHARIEHASRGIEGDGVVEVDSSVIRAIGGPAVRATYGAYNGIARIRDTLIEDACRADGEGAVEQEVFGRVELEDVVIRNSGCRGIWAERKSSMSLTRVRIEGSAGIGLEHERIGGSVDIDVDGLRITGGGDRPARVSGENAVNILSSVPPDSLGGNAIDRLAVSGVVRGPLRANAEVGLELGWVGTDLARAELYHDLMLEPGAELLLNRVDFHAGSRLLAEGTAEAPIRIAPPAGEWEGITLGGEAGDTSRIAHVALNRVHLRSREAHTLIVSDISSTRGSLWLDSPGSTLRNATIEDADTAATGAAPAALFVSAPGVAMEDVVIRGSASHGAIITASDVTVDACDITTSAGDAVWVANQATGVSVHNCNLSGNDGLGLRNTVEAPVDAEQNWWGDPAGPLGPEGGGVSGNVDFDPWLTTPTEVGAGIAPGSADG